MIMIILILQSYITVLNSTAAKKFIGTVSQTGGQRYTEELMISETGSRER